jgi:3-oxoacyl-[acyl-carrier-protein] synthase-3
MAFIQGFGRYLPERVLGNAELAARLGCEAGWIVEACGIEERRIAGPDETVAAMAERAARACLAGAAPGLVIVASGTAERRFPGPAAEVALRLGFAGVPAIDLPLASAGGLFGMGLAAQLAPAYGRVLVVAAERMSEAVLGEAPDRNTAILFGDGAGAVLVTADAGPLEIVDSVLHSDGGYTEALRLGLSGGLQMDGRAVILQASRRIPAGISEVLGRNGGAAGEVGTFVLHQANRNLMERVARGVGVPVSRF